MNKVLITGANGFLGHHLIKKLIETKFEISILLLPGERTDLIENHKNSINIIHGDIIKYDEVEKAVAGHNIVINLAGIVGYWHKLNKAMYDVNVLGAKNIASACLKHNVKRLIHISSVAAVGHNQDGSLANEETIFNFFDLNVTYCNTKFLGEVEIIKAVNRGLDAVILCPGSMYGDGDIRRITTDSLFKTSFPYNVFYVQNGLSVVDVRDVAQAIILAIEKGKKGERYIITAENLSYLQIKKMIAKELKAMAPFIPFNKLILNTFISINCWFKSLCGGRPKLTPEMARFHEIHMKFSNEKSKSELGMHYTPFSESIKRAVEWYKVNGYLK